MPISILESVLAVGAASLVSVLIFHFAKAWWVPLAVLGVFWATGIVVGPLTNRTFIQPADLFDTSELHHDRISHRTSEAAERNLSAWRLAGPHGDGRGPLVAGRRGVPGGPRGFLSGNRRRHLPHSLHDAGARDRHQGRDCDEPDRRHRDVLRRRIRVCTGSSHELASRDVPRSRDNPRCDRGRRRRDPRAEYLSLPHVRRRRPLCRGVNGAGRGDRERSRISGRRGRTASGEAPEPKQRLLRPGRPGRVPVPSRASRCRVRRERRRRRVLGPARCRRRIHQSARDEHLDARADESRGRDEQLHDRGHGGRERVHLLLPRPRQSAARRDGDRRRVHGDESGHPTARSIEGRERSVPLLDLSRGTRHRDGRARTRTLRRGPVITARAGLRLVQHRIAALRRAVLTEVEDINRLIYHILRGGVIVSVAFLLFGFILAGATGPPLPDKSVPPRLLGAALIRFTPPGYLNLGVLVLIFTPVARVLLSLLSFLEERDRAYVLMTGIVLTNLLISVVLLA